MSLDLALVLATNHELFQSWKKRPTEMTEATILDAIDTTIDRLASTYKPLVEKAKRIPPSRPVL